MRIENRLQLQLWREECKEKHQKEKCRILVCGGPSSYYRNLLNAGLNLEYQGDHFTLSSVTGLQHLRDRMFIDQDFSPANIYVLEQKQKLTTISEEIVRNSPDWCRCRTRKP